MDIYCDYSDFQNYYNEIKRFPTLSKEMEYELTKRYKQGDESAGQQIIQSNLRFVVKISRKYFYKGYDSLEIIQEGNLGLIRALNKFDPERETPFIYYAVWWIEAFIKAFMLKSRKVTAGNLGHAKDLLSLDENLGNDDTSKERWVDFLTDRTDPEKLYHGKESTNNSSLFIKNCLPQLTSKEAYILKQRYLSDPPMKLKDLGKQLGISKERVRQIQVKSIEKLKQVMKVHVSSSFQSNVIDFSSLHNNYQLTYLHQGEIQN